MDQKFPWEEDLVIRALWQVMLGVVLNVALAVVLAICYFSFFGVNIKETPYFDSEFFVIVLLVVLCNLYYLLHYLFKAYVLPVKTKEENKLEFEREVPDFLEKDIVIIYSANHNNFALTSSGEHLVWPYSIKKSEQYLPGDQYFVINRWCILKKDIIDRAVRPDIIRDDKVSKAIPYVVHLKIPFHREVTTSYRKASVFNKWLNG